MICHWDDVEPVHVAAGHLGGRWRMLGNRLGTRAVGVRRVELAPGTWSTPAHVHQDEEEIFYVLGGSGISWQDGECFEIGEGDCIVHPPRTAAHTLCAGEQGLDALAFGERLWEGAVLPRAGVTWIGAHWVELAGAPTPYEREARAGAPELRAPSPRPPTIVNVTDVDVEERRGATVSRTRRNLGRAAGSAATGLQHVTGVPGRLTVAPHCHSAEEEIFVVLGGEGTLLLWEPGGPIAEHSVRRGHVVSRPPGTQVAHAFRSGDDPLVLLAYGKRVPHDVCWYPRSRKLFFRGVGVIMRVEQPLDYWDGED